MDRKSIYRTGTGFHCEKLGIGSVQVGFLWVNKMMDELCGEKKSANSFLRDREFPFQSFGAVHLKMLYE